MNFQAISSPAGRVWSTLGTTPLSQYLCTQVGTFFPDGYVLEKDVVEGAVDAALTAIARGWKYIALAGYTRDGEAVFDHLHSDRYAAFLSILARTLAKAGHVDAATRVYLLNKALHGFDMYHGVELPEVFVYVHPVGSVVGRAKLGNFLCIYQNCSIGGSPRADNLDYPVLGDGVLMYAKSTIIGNSKIGNRVVFSAGGAAINQDVPDGALVAGSTIKPNNRNISLFLSRIFHGFSK